MKKYLKILIVTSLAAFSFLITGCNDSHTTVVDDNNNIVTPDPTPIPKPVGEWQNKLTIEIASVGLKNSSATFGQKENAKDGMDSTDLKALPAPAWGQDILEVVFVMDGKEFNTVFQKLTEDEIQKSEMIIRTNEVGRDATISFNGISKLTSVVDSTGRKIYTAQKASTDNKLLERMKLVDTVAGVKVPFIKEGKLQTYSFTMDNNEKERRFSIVLDTKNVSVDDTTVTQPKSAKISTLNLNDTVKTEIDLDAPLDAE